jgi:hypothetical protein
VAAAASGRAHATIVLAAGRLVFFACCALETLETFCRPTAQSVVKANNNIHQG